MAFRFALNFANTTHRFIKTAKVTLTLDGAAQTEAKDSKFGAHLFDLSAAAGQKLVLDITIPEPPGSGLGHNLFKLNQPLDVVQDPATGLRLDPNNADGHWKTFLNPRLTGQWVGSGPGRRFEVNADLTFLDVTDYYQSVTHQRGKGERGLDLYKSLGPITPVDQKTGFRPPTPPAHYSVRLRILEFTGGQPVSWAVLIPDAVKDSSNLIHTLMFYRPGMADAYTNTDNLQIRDMIRYTTDPIHEETPFYVQDPEAKLQADQAHWIPYPECAWEKQLSKANKCLLFVHPFPHGTNFGLAAGAGFPTLLGSICKILWADQTIATAVFTGLHIGRIGMSGFSKGGDALYQALSANPAKIDELYLFDPNGTAANVQSIANWFARKNKKLRMLGGFFQHATMLDLEKRLKSADVFVRPSSKAAWGGLLSMYRIAVMPIRKGKRSSLELVGAPSKDPDVRELSDKSKVFFVRDTNDGGTEIEATLVSGKTVRRVIPDIVREEIAAQIHVQLDIIKFGKIVTKPTKDADGKPVPVGAIEFTPPVPPVPPGAPPPPPPRTFFLKPDFVLKFPMNSEADLDRNVSIFLRITKDTRHQWPVVGGDDFNMDFNRGLSFIGYLQQCLNASSFT